MKKITAILLITVGGLRAAFAHHVEGGSTEGLFGLKAEYLHVLLNPLPVYGLAVGLLVVATGLIVRSRTARNIGLVIVFLCAAAAWPVFVFGQHGYNHLYPQLDTESQQWLDAHMERAERFIFAFYVTAVLAVVAIATQKKLPKTSSGLTWLTLLAAVASLSLGAWISRAGGEVSHSEFRDEGTPEVQQHEHHDASGTTQTNGERKDKL